MSGALSKLSGIRSAALKTFGFHGLWIPIALAFLFVSLSRIDDGGTNSMARFATLRAMTDDHSFRIDKYFDWTMDWARTPDGHYYSNKAPGPTLIAFPVFWILDKALHPLQIKQIDEKGRKQAPRGIHKVVISTIFQVFPFLVLSLLTLKAAYPGPLSPRGYLVGLLAVLFGNTAAVLMSSYMGNPFAGMAMLGFAYFYLLGRLGWMSFFFGWVVLSDYAEGILVLPLLMLLIPEVRSRGMVAVLKAVSVGAAIPATLWCWYHTVCFGSPFSLPFRYEANALLGNVEADPAGLWGTISFLPKPELLFELLFGSSRGVLFTQPWLFLCLLFPFFYRKDDQRLLRLFYFSVISFVLLLSLNAGFPGWHGGGSPGPRYLAAVLPLFGIFLPALYSNGSIPLRTLIGIAVGISLVLRALVYATWILPPPEPIWPYYLGAIDSHREWILLSMFGATLALAILAYFRKSRTTSAA